MPRVGFRAFLLITTLASLLAATVALWMRMGYHVAAADLNSKVDRARARATAVGLRVRELQKEIDHQTDPRALAGLRNTLKENQREFLKFSAEAEEQERIARYHGR